MSRYAGHGEAVLFVLAPHVAPNPRQPARLAGIRLDRGHERGRPAPPASCRRLDKTLPAQRACLGALASPGMRLRHVHFRAWPQMRVAIVCARAESAKPACAQHTHLWPAAGAQSVEPARMRALAGADVAAPGFISVGRLSRLQKTPASRPSDYSASMPCMCLGAES